MGKSGDDRRRYWLLAAMSGVLGLVVFDETVVGVALPTIQADLSMTQIESHWVVNAYLLTFTCFVAVAGRLGDIFGRNRVFLVGGGIFMAMGPLLGGVFAQTVSWRWIFLINLPVVIAIGVVVLAAWVAPAERAATPSKRERFDIPGLVALLIGVTALTVALMQSNEWGWNDRTTLLLMMIGVGGLAAFIVVEGRRLQPLINIGLFRIPAFAGGVAIFFMFQFDKIIVFIFVPLYLQQRLGLSPIEAGLPLVVAILPTLATSLVAGHSADRFGACLPAAAGLLVNGLALLLLGAATARNSYPLIVTALILWGSVLPFASVVPRRALMSAVPPASQGQASGVNLTVQMMGGTIGLALCTVAYTAAGNFSLVFWLTGLLVLLTIAAAWLTFDRRASGASSSP